MIKPRRTKYQWVDSKWVQLFHELREVREKLVVNIYFRYVSMSATMVEAILKLNTAEPQKKIYSNRLLIFYLEFFMNFRIHYQANLTSQPNVKYCGK